jgi:hypothetical protein
MDDLIYIYAFTIFGLGLLAWMIYFLISKIAKNRGIKDEIREMFNAEDYGDALKFEYRNYTVLATFRPDIKFSIAHDKNVEGLEAPKGMKLTPLFLIIKIRKKREIREKLDVAIDFLNSIPTQ